MLTLTACGSASPPNNASFFPQTGDPTGELSVSTQLIIDTFKLEETENAVTPEQAAELLPLWQTMQVLSESDTSAEQETEALIVQIQETMTAEQIQATTDMVSIMQEQGMAMGAGPAGENSTSQSGNSSSSAQGFRSGGGMPPPDERGLPGGGPGGDGSGLTPDQIAPAQASRQQSGGSSVPPMLINAPIEYLQEKAAS